MKLKKISVRNLRNHTAFSCEFSDTTTLIYGKNGAGKTAILEAIAIAYRGASFRGSDRDIVQTDSQWYRIDLVDTTEFSRIVTYDARRERPIKKYVIDDKSHGRMPQKEKYPVILFTPDDLRMIDGSPARRREYLDYIISQYDPQYAMYRRRYERALLQRNKLLKRAEVSTEELFSWNVMLAEAGAYIMKARVDFLDILDQRLTAHYQHIAKNTDIIHAAYSHASVSSQVLLSQYEATVGRDIAMGSTLIGPHRHDILLTLREKPAADIASRGEIRTIVLAMKFIEAELLTEKLSQKPLILLDDVYGELDASRRNNLVHSLGDYQIIITSTDDIPNIPEENFDIGLRIPLL